MAEKNAPLVWSIRLFAFAAAAILIITVVLDAALSSAPGLLQRGLPLAFIVLPALVGALAAAASFTRRPRRILLSAAALVLNGVTAVFYTLVLLIAG